MVVNPTSHVDSLDAWIVNGICCFHLLIVMKILFHFNMQIELEYQYVDANLVYAFNIKQVQCIL